ncbi:MAG: hypothetical protein DWQ05_03020 [Calditrichaeota bacterium]|nr:MAG: hypothetical protein DWQ05_03020 [Calditrichota bacterium]
MIFAANRPDFFPGLMFWAKMINSDALLLADDLQFISKSTINRCLIKTVAGAQWLTVPILAKGFGEQKIKDVRINNDTKWRQKHWKTLLVNYKNAAYFEKYDLYLKSVYAKKWTFLIDFNFELIQFVKQELGIESKLKWTSAIDAHEKGAALIAAWAKKLEAETYVVEGTFQKYLTENAALIQDLKVQYINLQIQSYFQQFENFTPGLSVIDLLFNEGDEAQSILREMGKI